MAYIFNGPTMTQVRNLCFTKETVHMSIKAAVFKPMVKHANLKS